VKKLISKISVAVFLALALFIVTTLVLPVASARADASPEYWAVLVGVSDYKYAIGDLSYCDDDVRDLSDILSPVWGSSHVRTLIDSQATKANILDAIDWLADNAGPEDTVLFSFSGHGSDYLDGYLSPYDALTYSWANDISSSTLAAAFQPVQADKITIILDICHAGEFQSNMGITGRVILMACRSYETSGEFWELQNGAYTYYILQAVDEFEDADANNDYELSAEEIAEYANPLANDYNSTQHPFYFDGYYGELSLLARFIFSLNIGLPYGTTVLTIDGETYTSAPEPMLWIPGVSHTITVPQLVDPGSGTRYVFIQWDDGSVTVTRVVTQGSYTANYDKEHLLEVISAFGGPQGSGWYKDGASAGFSVTDYVELPDTKHYFTGWSGDYTGTSSSASIYMDAPQSVTANWRHEYLLTLNSAYGTLTGAGWYEEGKYINFSVTDYVELPDTKHYFTGWSGDYTGTSSMASLTMDGPKVVDANWRHEYLLTINSEYGEPEGAGWYDEGEMADVYVEPVQGFLVRHIFDGWSGDLTDDDADSSVVMNSPKDITATWRTDLVQLYILIGGVVVVAVIVTIIVRIRKRGA
jgi:uncharacterized repeat protein (TIGR02543 family)